MTSTATESAQGRGTNPVVLTPEQWEQRMRDHELRVDEVTRAHMARRRAGTKHPVFDFLFEYYPIRVSHMHRWHPGVGVILEGDAPHGQWKGYQRTQQGITLDTGAFLARRANTVDFIRTLLEFTSTNPAHFDCFGLHEWAMVYQTDKPRHDLPLRLGTAGTNKVVEENNIRCTHFDAFRFFTPPARPLNLTVLTRQGQTAHEQRGCLHASMDLYKWAAKLGPLVPGELWLDCFDLAWDARILDMEASPYDCREYGLGVVPIETSEGKAEYVLRQREIARRGEHLRTRLVATIDEALLTLD